MSRNNSSDMIVVSWLAGLRLDLFGGYLNNESPLTSMLGALAAITEYFC